ncbi:MAG: hypothetical protein WC581_02955 [Thermodesulfovibrionales bacterium]
MKKTITIVSITFLSLFSGCAHLDFGDEGLTYYDPKPYLFVSTTRDCVTTAVVLVVPEQKKAVKFISGYGTADLSVGLNNGMITSAGQKTDTKIPETIGAITSIGTAMAGLKLKEPGKGCPPTAVLYPIVSGEPDKKNPIPFDVQTE